ncbi:glycosyltransferase [Paraglaciecola sp. 25GB23A]|uniref:glycosyltransferase n=1 Tax=Paraglaciecola sp. 25GB23A TaxID=3156068 RepID=UPI0032AF87A6
MTSKFSVLFEAEPHHSFDLVVAMAVYSQDRLSWVEQAVFSVLNQTYEDYFFVIVIDGQVSEEIFSFLNCFSQDNGNVVLVTSEKNVGLSCCMNFVIDWVTANPKLSSIEYFFRMDSDDISLPSRFLSQISYFENNPNVDVLGTSLIEINEEGKRVGKRKLPASHGEILRVFPRRCAINHPTVAIRFRVFSAGFRYREELKNTQDYFFWTDLIAAGYRFANLPEPLLEFRRVNDFYKRRGLSKSLNEFKARFYTMKKLNRYTMGNVVYAFAVLVLRLMPAKIVKLAYKLDRYLLNRWVKHE